LVETNQIYARRVAEVDPRWVERAGAHLVKRSHGEPRWDPKGGRAVVVEQVTLYGLPLVSDRVLGLDRVDPAAARAWFITKTFVERDVPDHWRARHAFNEHNDQVLERLASMSARTRGVKVLDDDWMFSFFDERIGDDVTSTQHFDRWWKQQPRDRLDLPESVDVEAEGFPDVWVQSDIELPLTYRDAPGEPLDGVTVHLPLNGLNQITDEGFDWQIPGHRHELVDQLIRSLPKTIRRELIPLAETVDVVLERLGPPVGRLVDRLAKLVTDAAGVPVPVAAFRLGAVDAHLRMHFVVTDDSGNVHDVGTDLAAVKERLANSARQSIAAAAPIDERRGITTWDFGDLPRMVESVDRTLDVRAYPTLLDVGDSVSLRVVTTPELQHRALRGGVRRLLLLEGAPTHRSIEKLVTNAGRIAMANADVGVDSLVDDCVAAAVDQLMAEHGPLPFTEAEFRSLQSMVRAKGPNRAGNALASAVAIVAAAAGVNELLARLRAPVFMESVNDANLHLGRLVRPGMISAHGLDRLSDVERYVRGIRYRLEHLGRAGDRDVVRMSEVLPLEARFSGFVDRVASGNLPADTAAVRWMLEELRVQTFAQPIGTNGSVSLKKVSQRLTRLGAHG